MIIDLMIYTLYVQYVFKCTVIISRTMYEALCTATYIDENMWKYMSRTIFQDNMESVDVFSHSWFTLESSRTYHSSFTYRLIDNSWIHYAQFYNETLTSIICLDAHVPCSWSMVDAVVSQKDQDDFYHEGCRRDADERPHDGVHYEGVCWVRRGRDGRVGQHAGKCENVDWKSSKWSE